MGAIRWTPIAGWCAATATSVVMATVALLPVLNATSPDDRALSTIGQLPAAATSFPTPPPTSTSSPVPAASRTARHSRPAPATTTTSKTPATTTPPTTAPTKAPQTSTEDGWTVTTSDDGLRTYVRSFKVAGGQAVIRMTSDAVVTAVTATPADGYTVQKVQNTPDNLAVYFNQTNHSFIIHAAWNVDKPFVEVSEVGS